MKRFLYIVLFGFLGLLLATLVHGVVELIALQLIFGDEANSDTIWWREWQTIHDMVGVSLWLAGLILGLYLGHRWWLPYGSKPGLYHWRR